MTDAEYAVMFHVWDTVELRRDGLADYAATYPPNVVTRDLSVDECLTAIDALVRHGLLVELTTADLEADLAFWRAERRPVSWAVDRDRVVGQVSLTERGFRLMETSSRQSTTAERSPRVGYEQTSGVIHALGETAEACEREARHIVDRVLPAGEHWKRDAATEQPRDCGSWWHSRYDLVPTGFEIVFRRLEIVEG